MRTTRRRDGDEKLKKKKGKRVGNRGNKTKNLDT